MHTATTILNEPTAQRTSSLQTTTRLTVAITSPIALGTVWVFAGSGEWEVSGLTAAVLAQLLAVTVVTDLSRRKIPNLATYPAFAAGLFINLVAFLLPEQTAWLGAVGLMQSIGGGLGLLAIMFVIFSISGGGAGDVKLSACLGALLGWDLALDAMLCSFVVAGAGMLCYAIWTHGPWQLTTMLMRWAGCWLLPTVVDPPTIPQRAVLQKKFPLAPFFAAGTLLAIYLCGA